MGTSQTSRKRTTQKYPCSLARPCLSTLMACSASKRAQKMNPKYLCMSLPPSPPSFFNIYSYFSLLPKISVKREAMPVHVDGMSALKRAPIMKSFIPFSFFFFFSSPHTRRDLLLCLVLSSFLYLIFYAACKFSNV